MRVLIIEDEPASLKLAALVLSSEGHEVTQAKSAEQAIKEVSEKCPDVILLDLGLPGIDGLGFARNVKEDPRTRGTPIVAVTAYPLQFSQAEAFEAGCDAYIVKPIDTRNLSSQVVAVARNQSRSNYP